MATEGRYYDLADGRTIFISGATTPEREDDPSPTTLETHRDVKLLVEEVGHLLHYLSNRGRSADLYLVERRIRRIAELSGRLELVIVHGQRHPLASPQTEHEHGDLGSSLRKEHSRG